MPDNVKVIVCIGIEDSKGLKLYEAPIYSKEFVHEKNALKWYHNIKAILKGVFSL